MKRVEYLDGLRGVAAAMVFIFHFAQSYYPATVYGQENLLHSNWEKYIYGTPIGFIQAGLFAVFIFFVLTGFFVTYQFRQTNFSLSQMFRFMLSHWFRIIGPAAISVLIAYILVISGVEVFRLSQSDRVIPWGFPVQPDIQQAVSEVFQATVQNITVSYNRPLWPLSFFFLGSIAVYVFVHLVKKPAVRMLSSALASILLFITPYGSIFLGSLLADIYWYLAKKEHSIIRERVGLFCIVLAVYFGSFPLAFGDLPAGLHNWQLIDLPAKALRSFNFTLGAGLLVLGVILNSTIQKMLTRPIMKAAGKISFSVFVIHGSLLASVSPITFLIFRRLLPYDGATFAALVITSIALVGVAMLFYRWVEKPVHRVSRRINNPPTENLQ